MKFTILFILFFATRTIAYTQSFHSRIYTKKDGLSNTDINSIVTDKEGFLWVATASGLNRFDGNAFEKFYNNALDSTSIADNIIQKLFMDAADRLWIGTNSGLSLYHPATHTFSNYAPDTTVLHQQGLTYQAICDDNKNNIWVGTKNDLLIFDPVLKKFSGSGWAAYAKKVAPSNSNHLRVIVLGLLKKDHDELWVLSTYGLFSVNTRSGIFRYYPCDLVNDFFGFNLDYADGNGNVWISTYGNGIFCFNSQSNTWNYYYPPVRFPDYNTTKSITQYGGDTLMYTLGNAIMLFDARQKKNLPGINYYDSASIKNYTAAVGKSIIRHKNLIWMGSSEGLVKIESFNSPMHFVPVTGGDAVDRVFKLKEGLLFTASSQDYTTFIKRNGGLPEPVINSGNEKIHSKYQYIAEDRNGEYYINDEEHLYKYDVKTNTVINIPLPGKRILENSFSLRNMIIDKQGTVWVRSFEQGILKYDVSANNCIIDTTLPHQANKEINALYYDSLTNSIWYAEEFNGVYVYDIEKKQTVHYNLSKPPSQRNAAIIYMTGDGKGNIWLSDLQAGLIEYNYAAKKFIRFTENDGLTSNNCWWSVYDGKGILWINTDKGICRYFPSEKKFTSYKEDDGYPVKWEAYLTTDKDGNIYMPYKNGYYTWNSGELTETVKGGSIYLRDAMLFNRHLPSDTSFSFLHNENSIQFLFGLLSFDNRDAVTIEYSLNGSSWITADIHAYISFANLSPGHYDLLVKIKNENIRPLQIQFVIAKPFWQQWWFKLLLAALLITGIIIIIRNRMYQFRKETMLRQKVMESEMSALRSQMNPHFIFNTLNSINSYIIENKKDEASDYLTDFSRLMRIILEHSQKRTVTLAEELDALKLYLELESKRLNAVFDYNITISRDIDPKEILTPPLIIQPFAENAIWHGLREKRSGGHIGIVVRKYDEGIWIVVQDDGIGRQAAEKIEKIKEGNSFGTAATMQRILLNDPRSKVETEDLYAEDGKAAGTRVNIYLYHNFS